MVEQAYKEAKSPYDIVIDEIVHKTNDQITLKPMDNGYNTIPRFTSLTMYRDLINQINNGRFKTKTTTNQNPRELYGVDEDKAAF